MSEAQSALNGVAWSRGIADVTEAPLQGMITLRGDLSASAIKKVAKAATSLALPERGHATMAGDHGMCWMSPDEVLVLCPYDTVAETLSKMQTDLGKTHALAVDVSDARAVFRLSGPKARQVMAKLAPVDFGADVFTQGMFRRSRMAQVPAAFWLHDADTFQIVCFRSQAQYMFDILKVAAQPGSAVF
jgi:sarcosine oxidase subunit gamma